MPTIKDKHRKWTWEQLGPIMANMNTNGYEGTEHALAIEDIDKDNG